MATPLLDTMHWWEFHLGPTIQHPAPSVSRTRGDVFTDWEEHWRVVRTPDCSSVTNKHGDRPAGGPLSQPTRQTADGGPWTGDGGLLGWTVDSERWKVDGGQRTAVDWTVDN